MICQDTIDLLGHVSVEAPETSLNVRDRRILLCADDCPCERRIRIAIEEDYVRIDLVNDRFDPSIIAAVCRPCDLDLTPRL